MKNLLTTLLFCYITLFTVNAQTFDWVNTAEIFQRSLFSDIRLDPSGNIFSAGIVRDSIVFDSVPAGITKTIYGPNSSYLMRSDSSGLINWLGQINGRIYSFDVDQTGNTYVSFFYIDTIDADPGSGVYLMPPNNAVGFVTSNGVIKVDPFGNLIWAKNIIAEGLSSLTLRVDLAGNIYFVGEHSGKIDLDPSPINTFSPSLLNQISLFKWTSNGDFVWGGGFGGFSTTDIVPISMTIKDRKIVLTGNYTGTVDFNIDTNISNFRSSVNFSNLYILVYDTSGTFNWVRDFSKQNSAEIMSSYLDTESNVYVSGEFNTVTDFNFGSGQAILTPLNGDNIFVLSLDSLGSFRWVKQISSLSIGPQIFNVSTHIGNSNNLYITGFIIGNFDLTPTTPGINIIAAPSPGISFTIRYDFNGNYQDYWMVGSNGGLGINRLTVSKKNSLVYAGSFVNTVDFDPSSSIQLRSSQSFSIYTLRLNQCFETNSQLIAQSCGDFLSPSGNYVWNASGTYADTIPNHMGCDSVIDINLSIVNTDTTLFLLGSSLANNEFSAAFQWLDCNSNYAVIPNQTAQLFTPTQNGNYALEITKNGCVDTTSCFAYTLVGNQELSLENSIQIFPNPSNGQFNLLMSSPYDRLTITDISGRIVWNQNESSNSNTTIDLSLCKNGIYFMEIISGGERSVRKLIKK